MEIRLGGKKLGTNFIAALWICFILCSMVSLVAEKAYLDTDPTNTTPSILNMIDLPLYISKTSAVDVSFPVLVAKFFAGIWKILVWDYSFFSLNPVLQIVRIVICYPITLAAVWGLLQMFTGAIQSFFRL